MSRESGSYRGRFAPSPTGKLHFGSLVAALASYLQAIRFAGDWIIRIDDIDPPREVAGAAQRIVRDLATLGMHPTRPVDHQRKRMDRYQAACQRLVREGAAYPCGCTRAELPSDGQYPGTCRSGLPNGRRARSIRLKTNQQTIEFSDGVQGMQRACLALDQGDFVIWRADGLPSYQLATAIDDAAPGMTEVVRGADLLESTFRQIAVRRALGLDCPRYAHVPVATRNGEKLSKRLGSDPIAAGSPVTAVTSALAFLGQDPPKTSALPELWEWARSHWDLAQVPALTGTEWP